MSESDGRMPSPRVTVFCSTTENIGQTTTLLNTAVLLARSGRRVLVLDARQADTRTRTYVRSVVAGPALLPDTEDGPAVEEWLPADAEHPIGIATLKGPEALAGLPAPGAPAFRPYDDVLVDAPLVRTGRQAADLARLPSVLVVCFTAASAFIESAVELAERLRGAAGRPFDVVALALQTDPSHEDQLRLARERVHEQFAPLGADRPVRHLEIPYHALSERSTRLGTESEPGNGFDERVRPALDRLVRALDRPRFVPPSRAVLVHSPRHAVWAEWIRDLLWGAGVDVTLRSYADWRPEPPADEEVVLLLPPTAPGPEDEQALRWLSDPGIRIVLVDDEALPRSFAHHQQIDLRRLSEQQAAVRLSHSLGLQMPSTTAPRGRRFPCLPGHTNIVARNTAFVGRERLLGDLRTTLTDLAGEARPCLVVGAPGVGKSETLLEFCHRFGGSYDLVWWMQADTPGEALTGLGALGDALGEPTTQDPAAHVRALRARADAEGRRWLLVCDEIDDTDRATAVAGQLPRPSERCHVLLGVRDSHTTTATATAVEVPPFTRQESEALLTVMVRGLTPTDAQDVAKRVGSLPLAVRLAACWLRVATVRAEARNKFGQEALSLAVNDFSRAYDDRQQAHAAAPLPSVEVLLHLTRASLLKSPAAAAWAREDAGSGALDWLLQACALLTSAGSDLQLLRSRPLGLALARSRPGPATGGTAVRPSDQPLVDASLWALNRHGLIDFDFARPRQPVRQHRVLRGLVLAGMGDGLRAVRENELRAAVAAARLEADGDDRPTPTPLQLLRRGRQIESLRLWEDERPEVQSALLGHVSDLIVSQEKQALDEALRLTRLAEEHWQPESFEGLRVRSMMSQTLRLMQEYGDSARLARSVLQSYRTQLGLTHPRSQLMADAYAANLVAAGHFGNALNESVHVARSMMRLLGPRHWACVQARRNLAERYALVGNATEGLRVLRQLYEALRAIHGDHHPDVQDMVPDLAQMHRLLGQNSESHQLLKGSRILSHPPEPRSTGVPLRVKAENGLAVSERRLGRHDRARERDTRTLGLAEAVLGERSLTTLGCRFSLAVDHHLVGDHDGAVREAEICLGVLRGTLGDEHPSTHLCRVRFGVHLRGAGRLEGAAEAGRVARAGLERRLARHHPWVLAAASSLANTLVALGDLDAARALEEATVQGYDRTGLGRHPDRVVVADNLAMTRAEEGGAPPGGELPQVRRDIDLELL
ncbi:tetratricopeptide repeat protein [Streptomyces sp. MUM 2J]|nr:tetratricopeptide repeat protein [Streptomyces sp. MUM 2J]